LAKAETDFATRRQIIDLLDVRITLAIEDGQKVAYARCRVGEKAMSIGILLQGIAIMLLADPKRAAISENHLEFEGVIVNS
jgi:hypothetical protein